MEFLGSGERQGAQRGCHSAFGGSKNGIYMCVPLELLNA
jgi:hypothetical protein